MPNNDTQHYKMTLSINSLSITKFNKATLIIMTLNKTAQNNGTQHNYSSITIKNATMSINIK